MERAGVRRDDEGGAAARQGRRPLGLRLPPQGHLPPRHRLRPGTLTQLLLALPHSPAWDLREDEVTGRHSLHGVSGADAWGVLHHKAQTFLHKSRYVLFENKSTVLDVHAVVCGPDTDRQCVGVCL
jgi:hypothetical protein